MRIPNNIFRGCHSIGHGKLKHHFEVGLILDCGDRNLDRILPDKILDKGLYVEYVNATLDRSL